MPVGSLPSNDVTVTEKPSTLRGDVPLSANLYRRTGGREQREDFLLFELVVG
jgi:hypothetical protein